MIINPKSAASHLPMRCPRGPNKFVPIRYDIEAGKNTIPCSHCLAFILSIMWIVNEGSSIAMPMLAKVIAPNNDIQ